MKSVKPPKASNKVTTRWIPYEVKLSGVHDVVITGDFVQWAIQGVPLSYDGGETWRTALDLPAGEYQYRLIVDGQWADDPQAVKRVPNGYGSQNCVLIVS
ncbi:MAG TPA: glycogen-binding domain-containing protein [Planctomycetota bacterium]|nr:glycogen-binding domain-containing protein [Planctomycetota bacterium]